MTEKIDVNIGVIEELAVNIDGIDREYQALRTNVEQSHEPCIFTSLIFAWSKLSSLDCIRGFFI